MVTECNTCKLVTHYNACKLITQYNARLLKEEKALVYCNTASWKTMLSNKKLLYAVLYFFCLSKEWRLAIKNERKGHTSRNLFDNGTLYTCYCSSSEEERASYSCRVRRNNWPRCFTSLLFGSGPVCLTFLHGESYIICKHNNMSWKH